MNVEFINPFLSSLINVLATMAQTELTPGKPKVKKDEVAQGDVSGLIGMVGPQTKGSFSITFEESLALTIMERMLGERPDSINEDVTDMVGEITNMVTGGAKTCSAKKVTSLIWQHRLSFQALAIPSPINVMGLNLLCHSPLLTVMPISKSASTNSPNR